MESYTITQQPIPTFATRSSFLWSKRGIFWDKINEGDSFFVNSLAEAVSVRSCFRGFQLSHPTLSKNLRIVRRKEHGTDRYQLFFIADDGSTKHHGHSRGKKLSKEHRENIRAAHLAKNILKK